MIISGHVPVTDSHYLKSSLGRRIFGAYYLGCPMRDSIGDAFADMIELAESSAEDKEDIDVYKVVYICCLATNSRIAKY